MSTKLFRILAALSGIVGVVLLGVSFTINPGPPANATTAQLIAFAKENFTPILWGAWMQAVGPLLILVFAFAIVCLSGATTRLSGWMTMFGGTILMVVSLIEITFYIGTLYGISTGLTSGDLIHAVQHLYFIVAAPALFLPMGVVILSSQVLPRVIGYLALALGAAFAILGVVFLTQLILPAWVTAFAGIQAFWWLAAAIIMIVRPGKTSGLEAVNRQEAVGGAAHG
jgi:hypothetical protein